MSRGVGMGDKKKRRRENSRGTRIRRSKGGNNSDEAPRKLWGWSGESMKLRRGGERDSTGH